MEQQIQSDLREESASFHFLSANQILKMTAIQPRQVLMEELLPQQRNPSKDKALAYVFVSHRWASAEEDPGILGKQLGALQKWLQLVQELTMALLRGKSLSWPTELDKLQEGMPQAASLVARMKLVDCVEDHPEFLENPLDHIFIWYDTLCLPQQTTNDASGRSIEDRQEIGHVLRHFDKLVRYCEFVCLDPHESLGRAWCAYEQLLCGLRDGKGRIELDCDEVLNEKVVDWQAAPNHTDGSTTPHEEEQHYVVSQMRWHNMMENMGDIGRTFQAKMKQPPASTKLQPDYSHEQERTMLLPEPKNLVLESLMTFCFPAERDKDETHFQKDASEEFFRHLFMPNHKQLENRGGTNTNDKIPFLIPDLERDRLFIKRAPSMPVGARPLTEASDQLAKEVFCATFQMSCRDAAALQNHQRIKANNNTCASSCLQCGLHDHSQARSLTEQKAALEDCITTARTTLQFRHRLKCLRGHSLHPGVAFEHYTCHSSTCETKTCLIAPGHLFACCPEDGCAFSICYSCATGQNEEDGKKSAKSPWKNSSMHVPNWLGQIEARSRRMKKHFVNVESLLILLDWLHPSFQLLDYNVRKSKMLPT